MDFFTGAVLSLGLGVCGPEIDVPLLDTYGIVQNCHHGVGKIEGRIKAVEFSKRVYLSVDALHLSIFGNGEPKRGDRGTEFIFGTINFEW